MFISYILAHLLLFNLQSLGLSLTSDIAWPTVTKLSHVFDGYQDVENTNV